MKLAKVNTEYNDYDILAKGFVISGEVHNLRYVLEGVRDDEYPQGQELEDMETFLREELINSVYSPELNFEE